MPTIQLTTTVLFNNLDETFGNLVDALYAFPEADFNAVPFAGSWTAGQLAEHILKSNRFVIDGLTTKGTAPDRDPGAGIPALQETFLDFSTQLKSPDFIVPAHDTYKKEVILTSLQESIEHMKAIRNRVDLTELIQHGVLGNLSKWELLHFVVYHTQRHTHQLHKIVAGVTHNR